MSSEISVTWFSPGLSCASTLVKQARTAANQPEAYFLKTLADGDKNAPLADRVIHALVVELTSNKWRRQRAAMRLIQISALKRRVKRFALPNEHITVEHRRMLVDALRSVPLANRLKLIPDLISTLKIICEGLGHEVAQYIRDIGLFRNDTSQLSLLDLIVKVGTDAATMVRTEICLTIAESKSQELRLAAVNTLRTLRDQSPVVLETLASVALNEKSEEMRTAALDALIELFKTNRIAKALSTADNPTYLVDD